LEPETLANPGF